MRVFLFGTFSGLIDIISICLSFHCHRHIKIWGFFAQQYSAVRSCLRVQQLSSSDIYRYQKIWNVVLLFCHCVINTLSHRALTNHWRLLHCQFSTCSHLHSNLSDVEQHQCGEELNNHIPSSHWPRSKCCWVILNIWLSERLNNIPNIPSFHRPGPMCYCVIVIFQRYKL